MTSKEIATALDTTVEKVAAAIEGMGDINASMLPAIGQKIHGGKMAVAAPVAAIATTEKKSTATRKASKKKVKDDALALSRDAAVSTVTKQVEAASQPQVLEDIDANASVLSIVDEVQSTIAQSMMLDIQDLGTMMTPEMQALKTIKGAQVLSSRLSAKMQSEGLTVDAIVKAAIPARSQRVTLDDMLNAEIASFEVVY